MFNLDGPDGLRTLYADGYRVHLELKRTRKKFRARLTARLVMEGEEAAYKVLWDKSVPHDQEGHLTARARRLARVVEEIARYFNLAGSADDLLEAVGALDDLPRFELPGMVYISSDPDDEPRRHLWFFEGTKQVIQVIEDEYAEVYLDPERDGQAMQPR